MATTHKMSKTKIYGVWCTMHRRCDNTTQDSYRLYGARGIKVCTRWKKFENFYADMGATYSKGLSIDRIDNDKGYSLDNCRWATAKEQSNHTSRNRYIEIDGVTKTLAQWSDISEVKPSTVRQRFYVYGWNIERALGRRIAS